MSDLDPCEDCPYFFIKPIDLGDGVIGWKHYCNNPKPCPYISLDTIQ